VLNAASRSKSSPPSIGNRVLWGIRWGAAYSAVLVAWVVFLWLVRGSEPFDRRGVTFLAVVIVYVVGGPVTGAVVGLLLPFAKSSLGAALTGIVAAIPVTVIIIATVAGFPPWTRAHTISSILMAVFGGGGAGYMFRTFLSNDS